jgi:hypothetical protein
MANLKKVFMFVVAISLHVTCGVLATDADKAVDLMRLFGTTSKMVEVLERGARNEFSYLFQSIGGRLKKVENFVELPEGTWVEDSKILSDATFCQNCCLVNEYYDRVNADRPVLASFLGTLSVNIDRILDELSGTFCQEEVFRLVLDDYQRLKLTLATETSRVARAEQAVVVSEQRKTKKKRFGKARVAGT